MAASEEIVDELLKQHDFDRLQILLGRHLAASKTAAVENSNGGCSVAASGLPPAGATRSPAEQRPPSASKAPGAKADVACEEGANVKPPPVSRRTVRMKGGFVPPPPESEISTSPQADPLQRPLFPGSGAQFLKAPAPLPYRSLRKPGGSFSRPSIASIFGTEGEANPAGESESGVGVGGGRLPGGSEPEPDSVLRGLISERSGWKGSLRSESDSVTESLVESSTGEGEGSRMSNVGFQGGQVGSSISTAGFLWAGDGGEDKRRGKGEGVKRREVGDWDFGGDEEDIKVMEAGGTGREEGVRELEEAVRKGGSWKELKEWGAEEERRRGKKGFSAISMEEDSSAEYGLDERGLESTEMVKLEPEPDLLPIDHLIALLGVPDDFTVECAIIALRKLLVASIRKSEASAPHNVGCREESETVGGGEGEGERGGGGGAAGASDDVYHSTGVGRIIEVLRSGSKVAKENAAAVLLYLAKLDDMGDVLGRSGAIGPLVALLSLSKPSPPPSPNSEHPQAPYPTLHSPISFNSSIRLSHLTPPPDTPDENPNRPRGFDPEPKEGGGGNGGVDLEAPLAPSVFGLPPSVGHRMAARALYYLALHPPNKALIVNAGAVATIFGVLDANPKSSLAGDALRVLASLALSPWGREEMTAGQGLVTLVSTLMWGTAMGKENAAAALLQLAMAKQKWKDAIVAEGVLPALATLLREGSPRAQAKAQQLVSVLRGARKVTSATRVVERAGNHWLTQQGRGWQAPAPLSLQEWDQQLTGLAKKYETEKEGADDEEINYY